MEARVIPELHLDDVSLGDRVPDSGQLRRNQEFDPETAGLDQEWCRCGRVEDEDALAGLQASGPPGFSQGKQMTLRAPTDESRDDVQELHGNGCPRLRPINRRATVRSSQR